MKTPIYPHPDHLVAELLALAPETLTGMDLHNLRVTKPGHTLTPAQEMIIHELRDQASERLARTLLDRPDVRALICPASLSGDEAAIATALIPVLLTHAEALSLPRIPVLVASLARRIIHMRTEGQEPR